MPSIILKDLTKKFDDTVAADNLNLEVNDGEYLCILGPTGAGKTTCMRMICGLTRPDGGQVLFDNVDVTNLETEERGAAMLSQVYSLFPQMTVHDNVLFGPKIKGWDEEENKQLAKSMLTMVHLYNRADAYPHQLSGGMQQRVALVRALASGSGVLLLDEPLRALDARLRIELRKELRSLVKEMKLTAIHVTHDQDEAMEMADRIAIIRHGKIVQIGEPKEVYENPNSPFTANFMGMSNMLCGTITEVKDGVATITSNGHKFLAKDTGRPVGSEVVVAVKIGNTKISKIEEGYFTGKIERMLYEGVSIVVEMQVPDIGLIVAKLPNRKYDDFEEGDEVQIRWSPDRTSVFDIPEGGLENELKVE